MLNPLQEFSFQNQPVRIIEQDGQPWFVAKDVCVVLGLANTTNAIRPLDRDEVTLKSFKGSHRPTNIISESGLYALIVRSSKPQAKAFRKWVTSIVLPTIRKTGKFEIEPKPEASSSVSIDKDRYIQLLEAENVYLRREPARRDVLAKASGDIRLEDLTVQGLRKAARAGGVSKGTTLLNMKKNTLVALIAGWDSQRQLTA